MTQLTYIPHPNPSCRGNPFIEVLGFPLTKEEIPEVCNSAYCGELQLDGVPEKYHDYYVRSAIDNLSETYVSREEAYALYEKLRRMIEAGYKNRNPLDNTFKNKMVTAIHRDGDNQLEADHLKAVSGENIDALLTANGSFLLAGLSGVGKTTMMIRLLKQITAYYQHTSYEKRSGETVIINEDQITHLYVQVHNRKGQKAFLRSITEAVQNATGINYLKKIKHKETVNEHIRQVRKLVLIHNVGILVIDEAQNIDMNRNDLVLGSNEKTSMKFVEEIFNRIGVPLFFIGTLSVLNLFGQEATIARRTVIDGSMILLGSSADNAFWAELFKRLNQTAMLDGKHDTDDMLKQHLHTLSAGIPAVAVSLMRATLCHMSKFEKGSQSITIQSMSHVFRQQFSTLKDPLDAIKGQDYYRYEDLRPLQTIKEVNHKVSEQLDAAMKSQETSTTKQGFQSSDAAAEEKVEQELKIVRKAKSKPLSKKAKDVSASEAKKMGIHQLLRVGKKEAC